MKKRVYIHTNDKQWVGALVASHALKRNSANPDAFDVEFLQVKDFDFLKQKEGQTFLRGGVDRVWRLDDLQSFTPLRFLPPKLMGYEGRAVVIDPDIFAIGDVNELLDRDMQGKAVMGRYRSANRKKAQCVATSVMLLECARLRHWDAEKEFDELFRYERDYKEWMCLRDEPQENVGYFEDEWNDFDRLTEDTKMLHNTKRRTQPWKTGLPIDFTPADKLRKYPPLAFLNRLRGRLFGEYTFLGKYREHPDRNQEMFFFGLLKECLEQGIVSESLLRDEMKRNHVRHDAMEVMDRTPPLPA